uniref:NACHT domain-containing protein n=1 Tax=Acrobeloides nanus TaxID=290746 RepID=A0A914E1S0_9BILA
MPRKTPQQEQIKKFMEALNKEMIDFNTLDQYRFKIRDFYTCEEGQLQLKSKLPEDYIDNKEIKDFFDALVFAVNQPKEVELSGIRKDEIGAACKLIDSDLIAADIRRVMLDWFKEKAISDVDEARLRRLVPEDYQISLFQEYDRDKSNDIRSILLKTSQAAEQFEQLCQQYPALNIHWLKSESDQLIWQQSQGPLSGLRQYIEKDVSHTKHYSETELLSQTDQCKVVIISDTAGMGKTTVLTRLSQLFKQQAPDLWIVRIDLNNYTQELQGQKVESSFQTEDKAIAFLSDDILKLGTRLEQAIFKRYCQRIVLMLDGFDEISPNYREIVIDLVNVLRNGTIKQLWVTTRPNERDILEDELQQLSYKLEPFSKDNQVNFMTKFWQQTSGLSQVTQEQEELLADYAGELIDLLTKSIRYKDTELTGIPLQTRMLAEAFEKDFAELFKAKEAKLQLPEQLDLTDLYECFFKKKYHIQLEKNISQPNVKAHSEIEFFLNSLKEHETILKPIVEATVTYGYKKETALHLAAAEGYLDVVQWLVEHGKANVEATDKDGRTVLHYEVIRNKWDVVQWLVEHGQANVEATDNDGRTMLHYAARWNNLDVVQWLVEHGKANVEATDNDGSSVLHYAAELNKLDVIQWLVEHGQANVEATDNGGRTVLHYAAGWNKLDVFQWLVEHGKANVEATDNDGRTVLHYAARWNELDIFQWLVEYGKANVEATDNDGSSLLHYAAQKDKWDVVQWLVEHGKANVEATDKDGRTVLHHAVLRNKCDVVQWLVEHGQANVEATDNDGRTVLHYAARWNELDVVQWLVEHGKANVEATDNGGRTVLHYAAQEDKWDVVQWLVEHGKANVEATDNGGRTVLHYAAGWNKLDVFQWLVEHGKANVEATDNDGWSVLHYAARWNELDIVQWLVEYGKANVDATDNYGITVLNYAAQENELDVVQWLVEHGKANVEATDKDGRTVLHYAARSNKLEVVQWLVEHGKASVEATDNDGRAVLHYAAQENKLEVVQWLMDYGKANVL